MKGLLEALFSFFKSVRLAVVLILLITALSLLSTLVPQGQDPAFYRATYSAPLAQLIVATSFDRFFSSVLFLALTALFTVNLGVCAVDRFARRVRTKARKRFGPDLVHVGLLLLIASAVVTGLARQERDLTLAPGDTLAVSRDYAVRLVSFQFLRYANGSPRAWISTVDVLRGGVAETSSFEIRVNHPLRLKGVSVYQASYRNEGSVSLRDAQGRQATARVGEGFSYGGDVWYLADIVEEGGQGTAVFQEYRNRALVTTKKVTPTQSVGPYTILAVESRLLTGLRAVDDPGFLPVIIALVIVAAGLVLTFAQREREKKT